MLLRIRNLVLYGALLTGLSLLSGCAHRQLIETPNLYTQTGLDPFKDCSPELQNNLVDVLYATDRLPEDRRGGGQEYGYKRSRSLAFGSAVVEIGKEVSWPVLAENSRIASRNVSLPLSIQRTAQMGRFPETPIPFVNAGGRLTEDPAA